MSESEREKIFDAVEARLKGIQAGKQVTLRTGDVYTYRTDIGSAVWPWRESAFDPENEQLAVFLSDPGSESTARGAPIGDKNHRLDVDIEVMLTAVVPVPELKKIVSDLHAMPGEDPTFGGLADFSEITTDEFEKEEEGHVVAGIRARLAVTYQTALWRN